MNEKREGPRLLISSATSQTFENKYIFLDSDFLGVIFRDQQAYSELTSLCSKGFLTIDPLIRLEFLQSVYVPKQRVIKENFIDNATLFLPVVEHPEVFKTVRENALTLSYLYAHNTVTGASLVDLLLAGRALVHANKSIIVTGNRKDFPFFLFDTLGILNYEDARGGQVRAYSIICFNKDKYDKAILKLSDLRHKE